MTPEQERALLAATSAGLDQEVESAFKSLMKLIDDGVAPRDAVDQVMQSFVGEFAAVLQQALGAVMQASIGTAAAASVGTLQVQAIAMSTKLWGPTGETAKVVDGIVKRHVAGFVDSRKLALDLYRGYEFRAPAAEPLQISSRSQVIPKYMRDALVTDPKMRDKLAETYAKLTAKNLKTPELRTAYMDVLKALNNLESDYGRELLEKKLRVAFEEKMRYLAKRISETELHRAFSAKQVEAMMGDEDVEFVQIKRAPGTQDDCICVLITGRNQYGMGPGVYPKLRTPVPPFHPFCRCYLKPRTDLLGDKPKPLDEDADAYFLQKLDEKVAARVMGSQEKRDRVLGGETALGVYNAKIPGPYQVADIQAVSTRLATPR